MGNPIQQFEDALKKFVEEEAPDVILFSGGIDTTVLALLASEVREIPLITVILSEAEGPDLQYSVEVSKELTALQHIRYFGVDEAKRAARETIKVLGVFEPIEIRNSLAIYLGLELARDLGYARVMTGDGADELLAGYDFLLERSLENIDRWIEDTCDNWSFSSSRLARALDIEVIQPFMDQNIKRLGRKIPIEERVLDREGGRVGKYPLRKMIADRLGNRFAWRKKAPIEVGSGSNRLSGLFSSMISDEDYREIRNEMALGTKEQAFYYTLFKEAGLTIPQADDENARCEVCGYQTIRGFCRMCGTSAEEY